jgi:hypothetical protein
MFHARANVFALMEAKPHMLFTKKLGGCAKDIQF